MKLSNGALAALVLLLRLLLFQGILNDISAVIPELSISFIRTCIITVFLMYISAQKHSFSELENSKLLLLLTWIYLLTVQLI